MAVYIVTGKLGNGKTLVTVGRIRDALLAGRRVATNLDLNLVNMLGKTAKQVDVIRIPDKPSIQDLEAIGKGYVGPYDETKFGTLVLDECGTWFNSRNWQDKSRKEVNDWFLHARKLRWNVYLIIQDIALLDSQARDALAELTVYCRRLDNIRLPLIGPLVQTLTGIRLTLPRIHRARVCYVGDNIVSDVWNYRGNDLFACYKTDQLFLADYPHGPHCVLPPWHTHGRFKKPLTWSRLMRMTKIVWKRFKSPVALATGLLLGAFAAFLRFAPMQTVQAAHGTDNAPEAVPAIKQDIQSQQQSIITALQAMRISGTWSINGQHHYQFIGGSLGPDEYLTDSDLSQAGVMLAKRSPCRVDAFYGESKVSIFCM